MQHQSIVAEHKIHVHEIPKIATPKCNNAQCFKFMIISFIHNDNVKRLIIPQGYWTVDQL